MKKLGFNLIVLFLPLLMFNTLSGQVILEGYAYEEGDRGFLNEVSVVLMEYGFEKQTVVSNRDGFFTIVLEPNKEYKIKAKKHAFNSKELTVSTKGKKNGDKIFVEAEMKRLPGYLLDATISEIFSVEDQQTGEGRADALSGTRVEIYNNTAQREELDIDSIEGHAFNFTLEQGNHYTILLRKKGYFAKRLEAYINVNGCLFCFEGIGGVTPQGQAHSGIADNLTEGFAFGTLGANIEMRRITKRAMQIENINYDYNSARLRSDAVFELEKIVNLLKTNPHINIELGSHTDSRGSDSYNRELSQRRAESVVKYLVDAGIQADRLTAKGYGETQIANRCTNGVKCSDTEHEENRRTIFKVTGFENDRYDDRPLRQIIQDEQIEAMISGEDGSLFGEEYKAPPTNTNQSTYTPPTTPNNPKPKNEGEFGFDDNFVVDAQGNMKKEIEKETTKREAAFPPPSNERTRNEVIDEVATEVLRPNTSTTANNPTPKSEENIEVAMRNSVQKLPNNYTGFKVEIENSPTPLPESHVLFYQFGNIMEEETKDGTFAYLIGAFKDSKTAYNFRKNVIGSRFPNAKVIEYKKGRRRN